MGLKITIDMTKIDLDQLHMLLGSARAEWEEDMRELERELDALDKMLALKAAHKNKKKRT
jgi:HPt (histidine-containing phosphotransfer) domain-containing protein